MPEPSELFTNVYVKGLGVEVWLFHPYSLLIFVPFSILQMYDFQVLANQMRCDRFGKVSHLRMM